MTGRVGKNEEASHEKIPAAAANSHDEAVPRAHEEGKADAHGPGKEQTASLKLSAEETRILAQSADAVKKQIESIPSL